MSTLKFRCEICQNESVLTSRFLGVCRNCIIENWEKAKRSVLKAHKKARKKFDLPYPAPKDSKGEKCNLCVNRCEIGQRGLSFCGLRKNENGKLVHLAGTPQKGLLSWYFDPLPTNCVAAPFCEGSKMIGKKNLAVFYGSCLPGSEKLFAVVNGKPLVISLKEIFSRAWNPKIEDRNKLDHWQRSKLVKSIEVLAIDPVSCKAAYAPVTGIIRRAFKGQLFRITVDSGRKIQVTPDHPMLVAARDGFVVKKAKDLKIGDYIPLVKKVPHYQRKISKIDLINAFIGLGFDQEIMVYGAHQLLYGKKKPYSRLGIKSYLLDNWRRKDIMPLWVFKILDKGEIKRSTLKIGVRYAKKDNRLPAIVQIDPLLTRLLGYYLSEGDAGESRVEFSVGIHEKEIAKEIGDLIQRVFNVPAKLRVKNWRGKESSIKIEVRNKTLDLIFRKIFEAGRNSYNKKIPWFVFTLNDECITELLDAYFKGDGHIRRTVSNGKVRNTLSIFATTSSEDLALGIQLLLLCVGIQARLGNPPKRDNNYEICFNSGTSLPYLLKIFRGFIGKNRLEIPRKPNPLGLVPFSQLYPSFLLKSEGVNSSLKIWSERICLRRLLDTKEALPPFLNKLINGDTHLVRVKKIRPTKYQGDVYDLEVARYHTFMGASGLTVHNCSFDCLFCQNWHFREMTQRLSPLVSAQKLADCVDKEVFCVCFFGGDPTPQFPHALSTAKLILKSYPDVRICFETNGSMNKNLAREMAQIALESRGVVKFDLKAYDKNLHLALTGVSNIWTLENFKMIAKEFLAKANYPFLVASTLLVPGYIEIEEVSKIAKFIANLNPHVPYSLLAFYPSFEMSDLPRTSKKQAQECQEAARKTGLTNVRLGNIHLLT